MYICPSKKSLSQDLYVIWGYEGSMCSDRQDSSLRSEWQVLCHPEPQLRRILMELGWNRCGNTVKILHFVQNDRLFVILSLGCEGSWWYWVGIVVAILLRFFTSFRKTGSLSSWPSVAKDLWMVLGWNRCGNTVKILHFLQKDRFFVILTLSCEGSWWNWVGIVVAILLRFFTSFRMTSIQNDRLLVILSLSCEGSWWYWVGIVVAIALRFFTSFH